MAEKKRPLLLFTTLPADSHAGPLLQVAEYMVKRGYEVVFVASREFEDKILRLGAEYVQTLGPFELVSPASAEELLRLTSGFQRALVVQETFFFKPMPHRTQIFHETLVKLRERNPDRQIIIVADTASASVHPFKFGRELPEGFVKFPKTIGISIAPLYLESIDTGPFLLGLPPDSTESGRLRNQVLYRLMLDGPWKPWREMHNKYLLEAGATFFPNPETMPLDAYLTHSDICLQMCSPDLEYPMSDLPQHIIFAGCLPRKPIRSDYPYPYWWPEITGNAGKKKVVFVTQGTIATQWGELVIPTLQGLDGRDDLIVVATLGVRGATLPRDVKVPANARVQDYLLYDAILQYADVFVSNGGYGSMTHSVVNGVPQVLAGEIQDKGEVSMRVEWAGFGVNLGTQTPTPAQIRNAVDTVLTDPKYRERALEVKQKNEEMNSLSCVENQVLKFTE